MWCPMPHVLYRTMRCNTIAHTVSPLEPTDLKTLKFKFWDDIFMQYIFLMGINRQIIEIIANHKVLASISGATVINIHKSCT